jgi:hypothetical protein
VAAQSATAAALTAFAWFRGLRPRFAFLLLVLAIWGCVLAGLELDIVPALSFRLTPERALTVLGYSSTLATIAMLFAGPRWLGVVAIGTRLALARADAYFVDSEAELAALHLVAIALLLGLHPSSPRRVSTFDRRPPRFDHAVHDAWIFAVATTLACLVSIFVLGRSCDSADEWSYTFQAAVFAKGRAYAAVPPCMPAFQNFWIFWKDGRMFSQYTPGWPLFCAPFQVLGVIWLAAPVTLGLLGVGVARLARRAALGSALDVQAPAREVAAAGVLAGGAVIASSTMLLNGGSRFPHPFLCALFAWSVEAVCVVTTEGIARKRRVGWAVLLGGSTALMLAVRPPDGAFLGLGTLVYAVSVGVLARRRLHLDTIAATLASFALLGGLVLFILRLQLGHWFTTGYSLTSEFYPWAKVELGMPGPDEFKWPFPLATGSYCWWPCAPALGVAGMAMLLRSRERRIAFMLSIGATGLMSFYMMLGWGRGSDFGYGPRYQMPLVVPMAVGGAVAFAPLVAAAMSASAERKAFASRGPAALALLAALGGIVYIASLVYPYNYEDVRLRNVVFSTVRDEGIHNAVVVVSQDSTISDPLDLTQNLPLELYPDQDILVISDGSIEAQRCVRDLYPHRKFYRTVGRPEITLAAD